MKNRFLLLMLLLMTSVASWGWVVNDTFIDNGITYVIINVTNLQVQARKLSNAAADADGVVTIPAVVADPYDPSKHFTVEEVYFHSSIESNVKTVILSEGIKKIKSNSFYSVNIDKLYIPASINNIETMGNGTIKEIEVSQGSTHCKVGACGVNGCGDLYTLAGELEYHIKGNQAHTDAEGVYHTPSNVKILSPCTFPSDGYIKKIHMHKDVKTVISGSGYTINGRNITDFIVDEDNTTFKAVDGVLYNATGTVLVIYPGGKTAEEYKLIDEAETVQSNAFNNTLVKTVDLNNVITAAFFSTTGLKTVKLGSQTSSITANYAQSISEFVVPDDNPYFSCVDGILFNKDKTEIVKCPESKIIGEYTIPETVTKLCDGAFSHVNQQMSSETFSIICNANLKELGNSVFSESHIKSIDFSACMELSTLGINTFTNCPYLESMSIPAGIISLGDGFFKNCSNLTTVNIPAGSLTTIGSNAFQGLKNLREVNIDPACPLKTISTKAFYGSTALESLALPKTVTSIGAGAFSGCTNLKTVTFADDAEIETIGANAFEFSGLESITLPEGVTTIGKEAFSTCDVLTEVTLPSTVTSISGEAFKFCSSLGHVNVAEGNTNYSAIDGMLLNKNKTTLVLFPPAKANDQFTLLPPSITALGDYSFYTCTNLKNVVIPNKVTSIGERTFGMCSNLNTITFLCDDMIPSANINQAVNKIAFDDDMFANININVRKGELSKYQNEPFYQKFKSINPSFENATEEYIAVSDNAVDMLSSTNTDLSYVIPATVTQDSKTYNVSMIGDYCFENASAEMNEVIVKGNVGYVGAKAFVKSSGTIDNIFFLGDAPADKALSTDRFELADTYNSFTSGQKVYVRRSQLEGYKSAFESQQSQVTYEIPTNDIMPNAECGSFAREFAVDLSNNGANNVNSPQLIAFVPMRLNSHDEDGETVYTVRMQSINEGGEGDGTYIPAGTGVLLRKYGSSQPTYYEIAESQTNDNNAMSPSVICNAGQIPASTSTLWNYYIGKNDGLAHKATKNTNIGVHKSYLSIPVTSGAKAVTFSFDELEDITTDISLTKHESTEDAEWYTVTGQKTKRPSAGLFIRNGKKFIVK